MAEHIGGQAVIEGVLMRSKNKTAIAVRKSNGKIKIKKEKIKSVSDKYPFLKWPFFRGILNLIEMLVIGIKALTWSADEQVEPEKGEKISSWELFLTFFIATVVTVLLFILLPLYLSKLLIKSSGLLFNLVDGIFRIIIFILYIYLISRMKDIQRVFQYHGAEHKAVHCYEEKKKLNVKNCKKYSTAHLRCGTSFLIIVLIISILVFSLITNKTFLIKFLSRIFLIPVIIGISYEILKILDKYQKNFLIKLIATPGLWVQSLTTKEPDDRQIEVAIKALNGAK